jgi:hypothetical protein
MSVEANDIHRKVYSTLLKGVIYQITESIRGVMVDTPATQQILFFVPCMIIMYTTHAPAVLQNLIHSIVLDTTLSIVVLQETGLTLFNLISVYLCSLLFHVDDVGNAAEYIIASRIGDVLGANKSIQALVPVIFYTNMKFLDHTPIVQHAISLMCMYMFQQWLMSQIPSNFLLPCLLCLLYAVSPFIHYFPPAIDFLNFLMVSVTRQLRISGIPHWIQIMFFVMLWFGASDTILVSLGQMTALRLLQLVVMGLVVGLSRSDAPLVYGVTFVTFDFLVQKLTTR